jgi:Fe-S cluster biogenesis protein NfuA
MNEDNDFRQRMQRIESLIQEIDRFPDPNARAQTREMVQAILDFHGTGLAKLAAMIEQSSLTGPGLLKVLARDDLVGSLLLLYGLHPDDLPSRVERAIDRLRPSIGAEGGDVEFLEAVGGVVRLRLLSGCESGSSSANLRRSLEEAIDQAAPDVTAIEVEEATAPHVQREARIPLPMLSR